MSTKHGRVGLLRQYGGRRPRVRCRRQAHLQRSKLKAGKTPEQVIASKPTAKYDAVWGKGFLAPEKFVEMLYGNLKK